LLLVIERIQLKLPPQNQESMQGE